MATVVIDPASIAQLLGMTERVQLLDKTGKTLGFYEPPVHYLDDISDEELDRREAETGGMTTADAIQFLKSRV